MPQLYDLYNKITSTLFKLDEEYNLNFVVNSRVQKKNSSKTDHFVKIYKQPNGLYNMYFDLKYYIEIAPAFKKEEYQPEDYFRISRTNQWQFMLAIDNVSKWLVGNNKMFYKDTNGIIRTESKNITVAGNYGSKLEMELAVRNFNDNQIIGINIFINGKSDPIFIAAPRFMNLKVFLDRFSMYDAALSIVSYAGIYDPTDNVVKQVKSENKSFLQKGKGDNDENKRKNNPDEN